MARRFSQYLQLHGYKGTHEAQLDPIRSEYPYVAGSGYGGLSAASAVLLLSVPSGKVFQAKYFNFNQAAQGTFIIYDGVSASSPTASVNAIFLGSIGASGMLTPQEFRPVGEYHFSGVIVSAGAAAGLVKVGGYLMDVSAAV